MVTQRRDLYNQRSFSATGFDSYVHPECYKLLSEIYWRFAQHAITTLEITGKENKVDFVGSTATCFSVRKTKADSWCTCILEKYI